MATIRKLRGRWQAQVRRRGVPPRAKSFDTKTAAERWARDLEAEADRSGWVADTRAAEKTTLGELLLRYANEVTPTKRGAVPEKARINSIVRCAISHRTLAKLTSSDVATYRDERLKTVAPATVVRELNTICEDLFGPDQDKEFFRVFDYCQNLEFFGANPELKEASTAKTLSARLFAARLDLIRGLDEKKGGFETPEHEGYDAGGAEPPGEDEIRADALVTL